MSNKICEIEKHVFFQDLFRVWVHCGDCQKGLIKLLFDRKRSRKNSWGRKSIIKKLHTPKSLTKRSPSKVST